MVIDCLQFQWDARSKVEGDESGKYFKSMAGNNLGLQTSELRFS